MGDYERALEVAGTGIGVVFLALVSLTLITSLLTRYIKEDDNQDGGSTDASTPTEPDDEGYEHTVNSHINRLRSKIEKDTTSPRYIVTVWGVGYKLESPRSGAAA